MKIKNNDLKMYINYKIGFENMPNAIPSFARMHGIEKDNAIRVINYGNNEKMLLSRINGYKILLKKYKVKNYTLELCYNVQSDIYSGYIQTSKENTGLYHYGGQCGFIIYDYNKYAVECEVPKYIHDFIKKISLKYY